MLRAAPAFQPDPPDHGGGIDAAAARFGGMRSDWLDLSTGINPIPYPIPHLPPDAWTALPDQTATAALDHAARRFWKVPDTAAVLAAPGASSLIARIPTLAPAGRVHIPRPTYNEHARAFLAQGWTVTDAAPDTAPDTAAEAVVLVHPNNPDGRLASASDATPRLTIIDESFCDVLPDASLMRLASRPGTLILKSFGKFWGLAGLRLGFAIGDPGLTAHLARLLGPWPVSGPALAIGTHALSNPDWSAATRRRLAADTRQLDALMKGHGLTPLGGTSLFRLYDTPDAAHLQTALARHRIWTRTFPYNPRWLRLGLPGASAQWDRLASALKSPG